MTTPRAHKPVMSRVLTVCPSCGHHFIWGTQTTDFEAAPLPKAMPKPKVQKADLYSMWTPREWEDP